MKCIKTKDDLSHLENEAIKESISNHIATLEQQYDEPYQATLHGWFVIVKRNLIYLNHFPSDL